MIFSLWYFLIYRTKPKIEEISISPENPRSGEMVNFCVTVKDERGVDKVAFIIGKRIFVSQTGGEKKVRVCASSEFPEDRIWAIKAFNINKRITTKKIVK
jgi:hypothetical protein